MSIGYSVNASEWIYVAWFVNSQAELLDDREWVAVLAIAAASASEAHTWGDHLAEDRCVRRPDDRLLRSEVQLASSHAQWQRVPRLRYGEHPSDSALGW
jgi:hypothetical protein